ncbi:hypothetical protein M1N57_00285 [Dehalococcoidales bacterium]|nr:hypothetical protein [Dehalococcoidales bacterium]
MTRRYSQPSLYRDRQCPHCGLWFTPQGLDGHIRFKHGKKSQPQPQLDILESKEIALAKQILDGAKYQRDVAGKLGEETRMLLFERVLIGLGEQLFGDKAIPLERLDKTIAINLKVARIKALERRAERAEAEAKRLRQQTP